MKPVHLHFVFPRWRRLLDDHPDLRDQLAGADIGTFRMAGLGLATAAGAVPPGHRITCTDENVTEVPELDDVDLVCLSFFTPQAERAYEIAAHCRRRGLPVLAGGIHPTAMPQEARHHCDAVVVGPVEGLWDQILTDLASGTLAGHCYQGRSRAEFARPRRDLFAGSGYLRCDVVQTARGCRTDCSFCVLPFTCGTTEVRKEPLAVVEDLLALRHRCCFYADESLLAADAEGRGWRRRLRAALDERRRRPPGFTASYPRFITALDDEDWADLVAIGLRQVYLVLGLMRPLQRDLPDPELAEAIARMRRFGIETMATFTLGHDQDQIGGSGAIRDFCQRCAIELAEFTIAVPFPGTRRFVQLAAEGRLLHRQWRYYTGAHAVFQPQHGSPEALTAWYRQLWVDFYADLSQEELLRRYARGFGGDILRGGHPSGPAQETGNSMPST